MVKKASDIILATSFLGTALLPIAAHLLQRPVVPAHMERIAMEIASLCIYGTLGLVLGIASGWAIVYQSRGNWQAARNISLGCGVLVMGWLEFWTGSMFWGTQWPSAYPASLWIRIEIIGEIPACLWALLLLGWGWQLNQKLSQLDSLQLSRWSPTDETQA